MQILGAVSEPAGFGHIVDEVLFGGRGGVVFGEVAVEEVGVIVGVFGWEEGEATVMTGQAVGEAVLGGDGFAFVGDRAGGFLGVLTIGGETVGRDFGEEREGRAGVEECGLGFAGLRRRGDERRVRWRGWRGGLLWGG